MASGSFQRYLWLKESNVSERVEEPGVSERLMRLRAQLGQWEGELAVVLMVYAGGSSDSV